MYRFYNLDGIRDEPCDILVAHLPPPYAQELEHLPLAEVQRRVMTVLRDMFSTSRNGGPERTQQFNSENKVLDTYSGDEIGSEFELSDSSGDEEDQRQRREVRQLKIVRTRADKQVRSSDPSKQRQRALARAGAFRADNAWKTKPVVLPLRIEITKWGQDPFAQGAYSCSQATTHISLRNPRLRCPLIPPLVYSLPFSSCGMQPQDGASIATARAERLRVRSSWSAVLRR